MIKTLVVDDSAVAREMISKILSEDAEINVMGTASFGNEAINFINKSKEKPDIIILDLKMPVMDGFETLEYIMTYFPIPCLIVTALSKEEVSVRVKNLGGADIIQKPVYDGKEDISKIGQEIVQKVKMLAKKNITIDLD
ncbi:MAG: response regulator [Candidatus Aureabacteria bacterium]|nr:response regulator [Candidatus Auribacterota bacterium]